jgi:dTDP-4-amino-4,6-dideoxygalactose transaminase
MEKKMKIPLSKVYLDDEIRQAVLEALNSGWYILQERVKKFEDNFAKFCNVKEAVCTSSGTTALFLSLLACNIQKGDEVIIPSFSFFATASTILHVGAKPVFVDIDSKTFNIDPDKIKEKISKQTKGIIPVHLFGHPIDMDSIMELADKNDLYVIEDACQAHGAEYKGKKVGGLGHAACFSFYPSKNMTVCGDGGIVTTNNKDISEKIKLLRDHGSTEKYVHNIIGYNMRFNEIQAAIGIRQLEKLQKWNETRRKIAREYNGNLKGVVTTPIEEKWAKHVYHMYVIKTKKRNDLHIFLKNHGISTGIHYPTPIHKQPAFLKTLKNVPFLENTEKNAEKVLSLPIHPQLSQIELEYVCKKITDFFKR